MGEKELLEKIEQYKNSIPYEEQAEEETYQHRLAECRQCRWLNQGVCGKCGCFVEVRALRKQSICPHEDPRWLEASPARP